METYEWYNNRMVSKHNMSKAKTQQQQQHHGAESILKRDTHNTGGKPNQRQTTSTIATFERLVV